MSGSIVLSVPPMAAVGETGDCEGGSFCTISSVTMEFEAVVLAAVLSLRLFISAVRLVVSAILTDTAVEEFVDLFDAEAVSSWISFFSLSDLSFAAAYTVDVPEFLTDELAEV